MLIWITLFIKLLEFWRLIVMGHVECMNGFRVQVGFIGNPSKLHFDCVYNQVLNLLNTHQSLRVVAPKLTALH